MLPLKSPRNRRRLEPTDADMVPESEDSMSEAEQSEEVSLESQYDSNRVVKVTLFSPWM